MAINAALPLETAYGNGIVTYFRFHINLLLLLLFDYLILFVSFLYISLPTKLHSQFGTTRSQLIQVT